MAKFGFILNRSPFFGDNLETMYYLADAALKKKHTVFIFLNQDAVFSPLKNQTIFKNGKKAGELLTELVKEGANVYCSSIDIKRRGLDSSRSFLSGIKNGELSDVAEAVGTIDRLISL